MNLRINTIIEELKLLTLLECVTLIKEIEKTFEIIAVSAGSVNNSINSQIIDKKIDEVPELIQIEEKSSYKITLLEVPSDKKIAILKIVRNVTGLGLKESKDIVDNVPKFIKEVLSKEESELIKKEFEILGAKIEIK